MSRLGRALEIARVTGRYRLDTLLPQDSAHPLLRLALRANPWRLAAAQGSRAERLRRALEELGPVFIKFGQMLSTRRDLLPRDIADELARLQDQVPPFDPALAAAIVEAELGAPVDRLFERFDHQPMASASVAQVHSARLREGREVVVKIIRPDIERVIRKDIALLRLLANLMERFLPEGRRLRPVEVVDDYRHTILDELDLGREAANASQLRRNFAGGDLVYVPEVFWDYSRHRVMVMERIRGIPVTDLEALRERQVDLKLLAERGVEIFFTQVFRDSFFHADMHPGNIFIDASDPADPSYIAIDCAIIGSLSESDQYYLARNLLGIFRRDYRAVAQLHVECGWVPAHTRVQDFEAAMRAVCEPVFERPIAEISFGQLLVYLFRTAARFEMTVQPSLVLLQKILLNIEGLGRQLYPQLNLWDTAHPFLERWVAERYSPQSLMRRLQHHAPSWLEQLPQFPEAVMDQLTRQRDQQEAAASRQREEQALQRATLRRARQRYLAAAVALLALALAAPDLRQQLAGSPPLSWLLALLAAALAWPRPVR
jgi:ubiquinone biosynthesis protein